MSERARGIVTLVLFLAVAAVASRARAETPSPSCPLAHFGFGDAARTLTLAEVEAVRALLEPPPSRAAAGRLVVDAAVAHRLETPEGLGTSAPGDWLATYRALVREVWAEVGPAEGPRQLRRRLDEGRRRFGLTFGQCYVPAP